jgi:hypothetical protein
MAQTRIPEPTRSAGGGTRLHELTPSRERRARALSAGAEAVVVEPEADERVATIEARLVHIGIRA